MGCLGSNGMPQNESKKILNQAENNLSKIIEKEDDENKIVETQAVKEQEKKETTDIKDKYEKEDKKNDAKENIKNKERKNEYKNKINLIYYAKSKGRYNILGKDFVFYNKKNIELILNGKKEELNVFALLEEGDNNITLNIKNKITHFEHFFSKCVSLKDITELRYLDISEATNFGYMFYECSSLSDIKSLQNWNVSNGNNFGCMF